MKMLAEFFCGAAYAPDWNAISAIATTAAVIVALWIPDCDRRLRRLERLESEAKASEIIAQALSIIIGAMPQIVANIKKLNGELLDSPALNVMYGINACRELIERDAFVHQLPVACFGKGALVSSLARMWCNDIDVRVQTQRNAELKQLVDWQNHDRICTLGESLYSHAIQLRDHCNEARVRLETARASIWRRGLIAVGRVIYRQAGP